jgi:hypothetical protein
LHLRVDTKFILQASHDVLYIDMNYYINFEGRGNSTWTVVATMLWFLLLFPRCDHDEEAHVKHPRHPTIITRAYYCCRYKSVSIIWHLWFLEFNFQKICNVRLTSFSRAKPGYMQILPVDRWPRDVEPINPSFIVW